jgi:hypothetical protein
VAPRDSESASGNDDAAVVDRLLQKLRANGPAPSPPAPAGAAVHASQRSRFEARSASGGARMPASSGPRRALGPAATWARVGLGIVLGAALTQWPYERACGAGLLFYLLAVITLLATALWGAIASWKVHLAAAHVVALSTVLWGLALGAQEALPRARFLRTPSAIWRCVPVPGATHRDGHRFGSIWTGTARVMPASAVQGRGRT